MSDKKRPLFSLEDEEYKASGLQNGERKRGGEPDCPQETDERRVVIVGIDLPLTNIMLLFLKFLLVIVPVVLVLAALSGLAWQLATHGTL